MPTPTYDLIAQQILGSSAGSVTFSSIPQTYRDFRVVIDSKAQNATAFTLNGSGGYVVDLAAGTSVVSGSRGQPSFNIQNYSNGPHLTIIDILDYSTTNKHKPGLVKINMVGGSPVPTSYVYVATTRYESTNAVTSIELIAVVNNYSAGATFTLYGIAG